MPWQQLTLNTPGAQAEILGDLLTESGAVSVTFQDAQDNPVFEPLPGETRLWGDTNVIGLYEADADIASVIDWLKAQPFPGEALRYQLEQVADQNWETVWMDDFHPMQFGRRLWICPGWCEVPDKEAVTVLLDPGLAFGTGTHPTTALCLSWLDSLDLQGKTVIDFGCGSGILAIAALKLGAQRAVGIDIDPQAIQASRDNARRNGVEDRLSLYLADDQPADLQADIVVANILASPLKSLAPLIRGLVKPGGQLGLSGILLPQASAVRDAYTPFFSFDPVAEKEEWCRLTGTRNK